LSSEHCKTACAANDLWWKSLTGITLFDRHLIFSQ